MSVHKHMVPTFSLLWWPYLCRVFSQIILWLFPGAIMLLNILFDSTGKPPSTHVHAFGTMGPIQIENQISLSVHVLISYNLGPPLHCGGCKRFDKGFRKRALLHVQKDELFTKLFMYIKDKTLLTTELTVWSKCMPSWWPVFWSHVRQRATARPAFRYWWSPCRPSWWPFSKLLSRGWAICRDTCNQHELLSSTYWQFSQNYSSSRVLRNKRYPLWNVKHSLLKVE